MHDRPISVTMMAATALWLMAVVLVIVDLWLDVARCGRAGIFCSAAAGTLTVRRYTLQAVDALLARERNAFELGRDAERIRPVR